MATRVFELARELGVRSKEVLEKCRAEGLDIKNHMSTVSIGLGMTIREWFSETAGGTAVELTEHVDLSEARSLAQKSRRKKKAEPEQEEAHAEADVADVLSVASVAETAEPAPEVEAPAQAVAEAPEAEVAQAEEAPVAEVVAEAPAEVAPAESTEPVEAVEAPQEPAEPVAPVAEVQEPEAPAEPIEPAEPAEPAEPEKKPQVVAPPQPVVVGPAGPQVVPRPATLKGPRVVRVERPDFVSAPPRRRPASGPRQTPISAGRGAAAPPDASSGTGTGRGTKAPGAAAGAGDRTKKGQRRSPRRRGGRTDSGEKLKEWRDKDLAERSERLAAASGGRRRRRGGGASRGVSGGTGVRTGRVDIDEPITVKALSAATGLKSAAIIKKLMALEVFATVNQVISADMAEVVVEEYGIELAVRRAKTPEEELLEKLQAREKGREEARAPVVTFLGHVDHGKTSLLDYIRRTSVQSGEAGGITQHIGAYRYDEGDKHVMFLDTPGHEAFTAMRARGANMTDVVVLVVAADDGVMPQTVEAISHAKAAEVPIVVALNKIDVPNANVQRAMGQLAEHGLQPRQWGGDTEVIETSAETGEGIDTLVETLSLEAELLELKAEVDVPATGYVIEAQMKPGLGVVARLLVREGTLGIGQVLLAGQGYGRIRQMVDSRGNGITEAGPATPVEVSGLSGVPEAGDRFFIVADIEQARSIAGDRRQQARAEALSVSPSVTLENLFSQIEAGDVDELPIIIKADVQGSVEALTGSLNKLSTDEVRLNILHAAVGGISTGDVMLAEASNAIIIGFNVVPDAAARQLAESSGVDVRQYRVIYEIIDDVRRAMEEGLTPEIREETVGHAEIRQVFKVSRLGSVAGCYVTDGKAVRSARVRLVRNSVVIEDNRTLDSLKRFKDDAREVRAGMECGLKVAGFDDIKEGDVLEFYQTVEVARTL